MLTGVSFTITQHDGVEFLGECDISEEELLSTSGERQTKYQVAKEIISTMLSDGDKKSNEVFDACMKAGVKSATMSYVKRELGIKSERKIDDWYWTLNPLSGDSNAQDDFPSELIENVEEVEEVEENSSDETAVLFLDNMVSLKQLPFSTDVLAKRGRLPGGTKNNLPVKMQSPYGELVLLDWRACL